MHRQSGRKLEPGVLYLSRALDLQLDTLIRQPDISPFCRQITHTMGSWSTLSNYHTGIKGCPRKIIHSLHHWMSNVSKFYPEHSLYLCVPIQQMMVNVNVSTSTRRQGDNETVHDMRVWEIVAWDSNPYKLFIKSIFSPLNNNLDIPIFVTGPHPGSFLSWRRISTN